MVECPLNMLGIIQNPDMVKDLELYTKISKITQVVLFPLECQYPNNQQNSHIATLKQGYTRERFSLRYPYG